MDTVRRESRLREGRKMRRLCLPESMTWRMPGTVIEVSAILVDMMILRVNLGVGWKTRCCRCGGRAAYRGRTRRAGRLDDSFGSTRMEAE